MTEENKGEGAKGEFTKNVHTQDSDPTHPPQEAQVTLEPVKMSYAPRLPRSYCDSQKNACHNDIRDIFFY